MQKLRKSVQPLKATKENLFGNHQVFANHVSVSCSYGLLTSVVDLLCFDVDPDPDLTFHHFDADPIRIRILPQVLHTLENQKFFIDF
jgi:hypothetical protein